MPGASVSGSVFASTSTVPTMPVHSRVVSLNDEWSWQTNSHVPSLRKV